LKDLNAFKKNSYVLLFFQNQFPQPENVPEAIYYKSEKFHCGKNYVYQKFGQQNFVTSINDENILNKLYTLIYPLVVKIICWFYFRQYSQ